MYLNTFICLEENVSGYGKTNKAPKGHVTISSPGVVKCYAQDLKKMDKDYVMYLVSKAANKAIRMGKLNNPMTNKQTTWKVDACDVNGTGIHAKDIDCVAIIVEGDTIGNTDTVMIGYAKDKYLATSMIQHALPKKEKPMPKPEMKPQVETKPMPKPEMKPQVEEKPILKPEMKPQVETKPMPKPEMKPQVEEKSMDEKPQGIVMEHEGCYQIPQTLPAEVEMMPAQEMEVEKDEKNIECDCDKHYKHMEDEPAYSEKEKNEKVTIDKKIEAQLEQQLKEFMNNKENKAELGECLEKEIMRQVSEVLQQDDVAKKLGQEYKDLNAQLEVIMSSGMRDLDPVNEDCMEEQVDATEDINAADRNDDSENNVEESASQPEKVEEVEVKQEAVRVTEEEVEILQEEIRVTEEEIEIPQEEIRATEEEVEVAQDEEIAVTEEVEESVPQTENLGQDVRGSVEDKEAVENIEEDNQNKYLSEIEKTLQLFQRSMEKELEEKKKRRSDRRIITNKR